MAEKLLRVYTTTKQRATVPFSIVLRDFGEGYSGCRYATHCRDDSYPDSPAYYWGHYFHDLGVAEIDFRLRCRQYPGHEVKL